MIRYTGATTKSVRTTERDTAMSIDSYEASRKRSDEIRADLPVHPEKYTMLTGDRPTGRLHLGHYFEMCIRDSTSTRQKMSRP